MAPNRPTPTLDPLVDGWQAELQYAIEAGVAPHIALGAGDDALTALAALDALRLLIDTRLDMSAPLLTAGGASGAWLAALTQPQNGALVQPPSAQTLYLGADPAVALATAGTLPQLPRSLHPPSERSLPGGYRSYVAPALQAASPFTWESLPLRALEPEPGMAPLQPAGRWLAWAGLLLVVLIVVGSFFA